MDVTKHEAILRDHYVTLKQQLEPEKVWPHLFQGKVLDQDDKDTITAIQTQEGKSGKIIDMLFKKPSNTFDVFVSILEKIQPHLACPLLRAVIKNISAEMEESKHQLSTRNTRAALMEKKESEKRNILQESDKSEKTKADRSDVREEIERLEEAAQEKDKKIRDLEEKYESVCEENKKREDKCKELERQLQEATEMEAVKEKLETTEKEKEELKKQLQDKREDIDRKDKSFLDLQGSHSKLKDKYKQLQDENKTALTQISEMQRRLDFICKTAAPSAEEMGATSQPSSAQIGEQLREEKKEKKEKQEESDELLNSAEKGSSIPKAQMGATSRPRSAQIGEQPREERQDESDVKNELFNSAEKGSSIPKARVFSYRSDFDEKGVIYALGTNFGKNTHWLNPGGKKALHPITVTRSSDGLGKPKDLLNYKKEKISSTKEIMDPESWWCVDLGKKFSLFLTHYTLRHGRNDIKSHLYNWDLQGSHDGENWLVLDSQRNHNWLDAPIGYMTKTWPIEGEVQTFRFFRIFQAGENSTRRYNICLSGMELYGVLHHH